MIIPVSYPLTTKSPLYPNTEAPEIITLRSMEAGDSANASAITFSVHSGTHIDAPFHFWSGGKTIAGCLTQDTVFFPAYSIDIPKSDAEEIGVHDLETHLAEVSDAEALFIHTGWDAIRSEDPGRYSHDHPWISPELPHLLREKCPCLRLFGIDQISISSVLRRNAGHECHRNFLCGEKPILILEDIDLSKIRAKILLKVHIYPFIIDAIDGVPVIAIVETE